MKTTCTLFFLTLFLINGITPPSAQAQAAATKVIMIDPAGHAKQTGRKLRQGYERAETYAFASALKTALEQRMPLLRVVLTRTPGTAIVPLQNASFANRLPADLFIQLSFYKETAEKPTVSIYHLVFDPILDNAKREPNPIGFIPIHQAHYTSLAETKNITQTFKTTLSSTQTTHGFTCLDVYGLPIKALVGITAPAITIECGLLEDKQWQQLVDPLVESIQKTFIIL